VCWHHQTIILYRIYKLQSTVLQNITPHTSQIMMRKKGRRGATRVKQESQRIALLQGISSSSLCSSSSSVYPPSIIHEPQGTPDTKRMRRGGLLFSSSSLSFSSSAEENNTRRKRFDMSHFALLPSRKDTTTGETKEGTQETRNTNMRTHTRLYLHTEHCSNGEVIRFSKSYCTLAMKEKA
jgi:hypothetical protein